MEKNAVLMKIVVVAIVSFALTSVALSVGAAAEVNHLSVDGAWVLKETIKDPMVIAETGTIPTTSMVIPAETPPNYFDFRGGIDDSSAYFNWSWESANRNSKGDVIETFCTGQVHEQSTWTIPPSTLVPGQTMKTDLEASFTASQEVIQDHPSCYSSIGGHCIRFSITGFRGHSIGPVGPCVGGNRNELSKKSSETIEWSVPQGIPGDTLEIRICPFSTGMGRSDNAIHFIYEYKEEAPTTTPPDIPPTSTPTPTEPSGFGTTEILKKGFKGNVYYLEEGTSKLPDFSKMTPVGTIYTEKLDIPPRDFKQGFPGITDRFEWFGISYIGGIVIPSDGNYTFKLTSDDGAKLYIDGELVIDNDGIHPPRRKTKEVHLTKGDHLIGVDYFQGPKVTIALQLFVETSDGKETPVKPVLDPSKVGPPTPTPTPGDGEATLIEIAHVPGRNLAMDSFDNMYVSSYVEHKVVKVTPEGVVSDFATGISMAREGICDTADNLYVGDYNGHVWKITPAGSKAIIASGIWSIKGLALDNSGNLYVSSGYDDKIYKIDLSSGSKTVFSTALVSAATFPTRMAINQSTNDLYVSVSTNWPTSPPPGGPALSLIKITQADPSSYETIATLPGVYSGGALHFNTNGNLLWSCLTRYLYNAAEDKWECARYESEILEVDLVTGALTEFLKEDGFLIEGMAFDSSNQFFIAGTWEITKEHFIYRVVQSPTPTPQQTGCTQFEVPPTGEGASESWFNTRINVTSGQMISISASGTIQPSSSWDIFCGPNGTFEVDYWLTTYSPRSDLGHAALIARIGETGDIIFIGTNTSFVAPTDGELWLGINDIDPSNNLGEFVAEICIGEETSTPTLSGSGTSYLEATLSHSGFDFSEGTTGDSLINDGEIIFWQPGGEPHPSYPRDSGYLWWRNANHASQTKDMGAVDIVTVREVPAEWDKSPLIPPLLVGHTIVAKCYDGYVKFQVISVDTADESARVKYLYSTDTIFDEGTPTPAPTITPTVTPTPTP